MTRPANPFRYFNSSPEVIRLVVMMYVDGAVRLTGQDQGIDSHSEI